MMSDRLRTTDVLVLLLLLQQRHPGQRLVATSDDDHQQQQQQQQPFQNHYNRTTINLFLHEIFAVDKRSFVCFHNEHISQFMFLDLKLCFSCIIDSREREELVRACGGCSHPEDTIGI